MRNIQTRVEGRKLIMEVDLDGITGPPGSGKTQVIATTGGNKPIVGALVNGKQVEVGVNCYFKP